MRKAFAAAAAAGLIAVAATGSIGYASATPRPAGAGPNGGEVMTKAQLIKLLQGLPVPGSARIYVYDPNEHQAYPINPLVVPAHNKRYGRWRITISPYFVVPPNGN